MLISITFRTPVYELSKKREVRITLRTSSLSFYTPMHEVAPSAVSIADAIDAMS